MSSPTEVNPQSQTCNPITTQRLSLREFDLSDTQAYYQLESNEQNARYQNWSPRTLEQSRELVLSNIKDSHAPQRTTWELVVEKDAHMVGRIGASSSLLNRDDSSGASIHFDLWFSFLPSVQGQGYATEAMEAFIQELVERHSGAVVELEIECDPRNTGSWRLAERLGFDRHSLTENAYESKGEWVGSLVYRKHVVGGE